MTLAFTIRPGDGPAGLQILVVNHALFFSDLALRRSGASILPDYDVVVLDEAHTIESVAGDHLGLGISSGAIEYTLNKLYNDRTNRGCLCITVWVMHSSKSNVAACGPAIFSTISTAGWTIRPTRTAALSSRRSCPTCLARRWCNCRNWYAGTAKS